MLDINGQPLSTGDPVQLLCEVVSIDPEEGVRVRILNSEMELVVGCKHDEALGGWVADSELSKFVEVIEIGPAEVARLAAPSPSSGFCRCSASGRASGCSSSCRS